MVLCSSCLPQPLPHRASLSCGAGGAAAASLWWREGSDSGRSLPLSCWCLFWVFNAEACGRSAHSWRCSVLFKAKDSLWCFQFPPSFWDLVMLCILPCGPVMETNQCYEVILSEQGQPHRINTAFMYPHTEDTFRYLNIKLPFSWPHCTSKLVKLGLGLVQGATQRISFFPDS